MLFALSGGMLIGSVDVGAAGYVDGIDRQVFTVELNQPADGQYRFTLLDNLDHHAAATAFDGEHHRYQPEQSRPVLDTGDPGDIEPIANFSINVIDDVPVAEPNTRTVPIGTLQTVDVQLIVDISGSMGDDVGDVPDFSGNRMVCPILTHGLPGSRYRPNRAVRAPRRSPGPDWIRPRCPPTSQRMRSPSD